MKKSVLLLSVLLFFALVGCTTKKISIEQSKKNFSVYENSLHEITDKYNYEFHETKDENIENQDVYRDFNITIDSNSNINIRLINSVYESEEGVESFSIEYLTNNEDAESGFNLQMFVDLVNCVSGKVITLDFCDEFLSAPESKYSAEDYGYKKLNDEVIAKRLPLNFFEDWAITYILTKDREHILRFGGLTKQ